MWTKQVLFLLFPLFLLSAVLLFVTHGFSEESPHLSLLLVCTPYNLCDNLRCGCEEKVGLYWGEQDQKAAG